MPELDVSWIRQHRGFRVIGALPARIGAVSALVGGILWVAAVLGTSIGFRTPWPIIAVDALLLLTGIVVLDALQGKRSGFPGWAGVRLVAGGSLILAVAFATSTMNQSASSGLFGMGLFLVSMGTALFAIGVYAAMLVPRGVSILLIAGWALVYAYNLTGASSLLAIPFGVGWILVGVHLMRAA